MSSTDAPQRYDAEKVIKFAAESGFKLEPWQRDVIRAMADPNRVISRPRRAGMFTVRLLIELYGQTTEESK